MKSGLTWLKNARYYSSVFAIYASTLLFAWYIFMPLSFPFSKHKALNNQATFIEPALVAVSKQNPIKSGKPVRITITEADNGLNIDLPVQDGNYDEATSSWTLSEQSAYFALISALANDTVGTTFIYGHSSPKIFGYLNAIHEHAGATAKIYTDNGKVFTYSYQGTEEFDPNDVSVFSTHGQPRLVVQTCSGSFFEYRRMFYFKFESVEG